MSDQKVSYKLGVQAGYKYSIVKIGEENYDPLAYYHKANFPDVLLTRPNTTTDVELLDKKCLLTVNGYIHPTLVDGNKLYVPKATDGMLKTKANNIGIVSFGKISSNLIKHKITLDMITPEANSTLFEKAIITFDAPIEGAFLVMAGYPVFEQDEFFYRVSDRSFVLRLDRLNYVERLFELSRYRNIFDELGVEVSPNNPNMVDGNIIRGDAIVSKFLSLFNTFLVEVPGHTVSTKKIYLEHSNVPGNFRTEVEPKLPVVAGYGKFVEYLSSKSNDLKYTVRTADAYLNNHLFSKLNTSQINVYNDSREVGRTYQLSSAFFLEITCSPI